MTLWRAEEYDENSRLQKTIAEQFIEQLKRECRCEKRDFVLLDIGSGTGRTTSSLLSHFPVAKVIGIDASQEMVAFAKERFANAKLSFFVDRAEKLSTISSNSVDAITSFSCLHWIHDQPAAFKEMYRVLKSPGWVGLMFAVNTDFDDPIDKAYAAAIQEEPWRIYFEKPREQVDWNLVDAKTVRAQLEEAGFHVHLLEAPLSDYPFSEKKAFQNWVLSCFQQLKLLPRDLQESCAGHIVDLYLEATADWQPKGPTTIYRIEPFRIIATK